jgi:hypothetical protein
MVFSTSYIHIYLLKGVFLLYLTKVNYSEENAVDLLSSSLKGIIDDDTIVVCIGTDRAIGDTLGPLVGTILKKSSYKYPVYG